MLAYHKHSIITLLRQVHELERDPWDNPQKCLSIQQSLIKKMFYIERRIRELRRKSKDLRKYIGTKRIPRITSDEADHIKTKISDIEDSLIAYRTLRRFLQTIGDALAFIYIPKCDIKPMIFKETAGFLSGKKGFKYEQRALELAFDAGAIAILNDLTTCLRYGDLVIMQRGKPNSIVEIKGTYLNIQAQRQKTHLEKLASYLQSSQTTWDGFTVLRQYSKSEEIDHRRDLNRIIKKAKRVGAGFEEVEKGLHYYVATQPDEDGLMAVLRSLKNQPITFYLNIFKQHNAGYNPFTLSIRDPESIFAFYNGEVEIFVLVDPVVIEEKLSSNGLKVKFEHSNDCAFSVSAIDSRRDKGIGVMAVDQYFFRRVACEFLGLDWFLDEIIYRFDNPPHNQITPTVGF